MLFGVLALMSFQLVDSAFIGQLGVQPLAALGFTVPVQLLIIGVQVGLGIAKDWVLSSRDVDAEEALRANLDGLMGVLEQLGDQSARSTYP